MVNLLKSNTSTMKAILLILTIGAILVSCNKDPINHPGFKSTTWEIWQYRESTAANPEPLNDTLVFLSNTKYTYNGLEHTYMLTDVLNAKKLTLYGTKFGDLSGNIPENYNNYGEIVAAQFYEMNSTNNEVMYVFWMKKVE